MKYVNYFKTSGRLEEGYERCRGSGRGEIWSRNRMESPCNGRVTRAFMAALARIFKVNSAERENAAE